MRSSTSTGVRFKSPASTPAATTRDTDQICRHDRTRIRSQTRRKAREPGGKDRLAIFGWCAIYVPDTVMRSRRGGHHEEGARPPKRSFGRSALAFAYRFERDCCEPPRPNTIRIDRS